MADRQLFLTVKQKLDALRLPSAFAVEDLALVAKLVGRVEQAEGGGELKRKDWRGDETQEHSKEFSQAEEALNMEVARLFRENNELRRELWRAREAAEQIKFSIASRMGAKLQKEMRQVDQIRVLQQKSRREEQLLREVEEIRYKYNELMELIHENPQFEREYIKRLIKFKRVEVGTGKQLGSLQQDSRMIQVEKTVLKDRGEASGEVSLLRSKLMTRQEEILRLQAIIQQNHGYVNYRYHEQRHSRREMLLNEEISTLEEEVRNLKRKIASVPHQNFKSNDKDKDKDKRQASGSEKQKLIKKKYEEQFEQEKKQTSSYILEQRYRHEVTSKNKEKTKLSKNSQEQNNKDNIERVKQSQNEYYHNNQIGQISKQKRHNSPIASIKQNNKQKTVNDNIKKQSNQNTQRPVKENASHPINAVSSIKKSENKPIVAANSPKNASSKPLPLSPSPHLKANKQAVKDSHPSIHPNPTKLPKSPTRANPSIKEQKLISTYQKLLQQKDARISYLQQQLKTSPSRSTKVISTQNINTNNSPSRNVIIKNNRNEYININNINRNKQAEPKKKDASMENEFAHAAKERERLAERVESLEKERSKEREKQQIVDLNTKKEDSTIQKLRNTEQFLRNKLVQTQNSLFITNQKNISLQKQVNQLIQSQRENQLASHQKLSQGAQQLETFNQLQHESYSKSQITFLQREIQQLENEVSSLFNEKQALMNRLNQYENLAKNRGNIEKTDSSASIKERKNDKRDDLRAKEEENTILELKNAHEILKKKLAQTQNSLFVVNQRYISLQKEMKILRSQKAGKPVNYSHEVQLQQPRPFHHCQNDQQSVGELTSLQNEIQWLKIEVQSLTNQKKVLIARLNDPVQISKERSKLQENLEQLPPKSRERKEQRDGFNDKSEEDIQQLRNNHEDLKKKLAETQYSLQIINQKNVSLQKELNNLLTQSAGRSSNNQVQIYQNVIQQQQKKSERQQAIHHCEKEQELNIKVAFLQGEINRLKIEVNNLSSERLVLLARLRELEAALHTQETQMRIFQNRVCKNELQRSSSAISEIAELQNDSEINRSR